MFNEYTTSFDELVFLKVLILKGSLHRIYLISLVTLLRKDGPHEPINMPILGPRSQETSLQMIVSNAGKLHIKY